MRFKSLLETQVGKGTGKGCKSVLEGIANVLEACEGLCVSVVYEGRLFLASIMTLQ